MLTYNLTYYVNKHDLTYNALKQCLKYNECYVSLDIIIKILWDTL